MLLLTIYEKIQMNLNVKFKGNRACASSIICRMTRPITDWPAEADQKNTLKIFKNLLQNQRANFNQTWYKSFLGEGNSKLFK